MFTAINKLKILYRMTLLYCNFQIILLNRMGFKFRLLYVISENIFHWSFRRTKFSSKGFCQEYLWNFRFRFYPHGSKTIKDEIKGPDCNLAFKDNEIASRKH